MLQIIDGKFMQDGQTVRPEIGNPEQVRLLVLANACLRAPKVRVRSQVSAEAEEVAGGIVERVQWTAWVSLDCPKCSQLMQEAEADAVEFFAKAQLKFQLLMGPVVCEGCGARYHFTVVGQGGWLQILPEGVVISRKAVTRCSPRTQGDLFIAEQYHGSGSGSPKPNSVAT